MYTEKVSANSKVNALLKDTHDALVGHIGVSLQMEQHGHVVLVVRGVEARDVD